MVLVTVRRNALKKGWTRRCLRNFSVSSWVNLFIYLFLYKIRCFVETFVLITINFENKITANYDDVFKHITGLKIKVFKRKNNIFTIEK